ncbi:4-formylbenzenesulfonate dehydrogenase TsaC1/TsaC2 [Planctomycetes bacterium MalM25]|nr:4-formylbenzenesulfonate dehydrogenase TsaC1/TsaC2 [Planctomycetes bacterium MalM25]
MGDRLAGKTAVVTGGGSGIGEAISLRFAAEGARVAVLDLENDAAQQVASRITADGGAARPYPCDVSDLAEVQAVFSAVTNDFGGLSTLVNNAGIAHVGNVEQTAPEDFDRVYRVNVLGVYHCLRTGVEALKVNGGGSIINMGSIASTVGIPDRFAYSMSKGAVLMMTRSVACDYVSEGIRCNSISPARVHTPFVDRFVEQNYPGREEEIFANLASTQPMGRMGRPEEIASLAVYLASDESAFVTGSNFEIDGGFHHLKP